MDISAQRELFLCTLSLIVGEIRVTQNLKTQVYGSSPHCAQLFHFYPMWDFTLHF